MMFIGNMVIGNGPPWLLGAGALPIHPSPRAVWQFCRLTARNPFNHRCGRFVFCSN
jgi:hypothetical protein